MQSQMTIKVVEKVAKYLGLLAFLEGPNVNYSILSKIGCGRSIRGGKELCYPQVGMIKLAAQAISTYIMGCFLLPRIYMSVTSRRNDASD